MISKEQIIFEVEGGKTLSGEIKPQGAKNEALQIICATLLTAETVTLNNVPNIRDVVKLFEVIAFLGAVVEQTGEESYTVNCQNIDVNKLDTPEYNALASKLRGSVMVLGPLLARYKRARLPKPGGDKIGRRRLDTHFIGLEKLGAKFNFDPNGNHYFIDASNLTGCYILLDEPSVTGTANIVMAAVLAKGKTTIYNAACEPYLQQLCAMLVRMGANIKGAGSNLIEIEGVNSLKGTDHTMLPDMIEVGSFIGLAAMTGSELTIKDVGLKYLGQIPSVFQRLGIKMEFRGDDIFIPKQDEYAVDRFIDGSILTIADGPWPMFTPDLISIILVVATQARGTVLVHQKMFESRLFFVDKLIDMGAQIILCDPHRATIIGLNKKIQLKGISMTSPDIRAGVALLIAALSAEGKSVIFSAEQIDRGYQNIDKRLNALGANIKRTTIN